MHFKYTELGQDILNVPQFNLECGEKVFMYGSSGSGKTSLLRVAVGLIAPTAGTVSILGTDIFQLPSSELDIFRVKNIGFVFQIFNLLPNLTVIENVMMPCWMGRTKSSDFSSEVEEASYLLSRLGLYQYKDSGVTKLSIGQQQRVAVARALIGSPRIIIADEPTSGLDVMRSNFLKVLFEQAERGNSAILFVSHDRSLSTEFNRSVDISDIKL